MNEPRKHEYDPNASTSTALVEVRTVLSRARTALEVLDYNPTFVVVEAVWGRDQKEAETIPHPELEEMQRAMRQIVAVLARWERRGSKKGA